MIDESLIASLGISDAEMEAAFGKGGAALDMEPLLGKQVETLVPGRLIKGKVIGTAGDDVVVEVGLKSEGLIPREEFDGAEPKAGDMIDVLLESLEGEDGLVQLSKRRADRQLSWQRIIDTTKEGDVVEGPITKKIKGGLLLDIGVPVFLPASQVDVRRPGDVGDYTWSAATSSSRAASSSRTSATPPRSACWRP
jgi:small subunit ribosomal protein S1